MGMKLDRKAGSLLQRLDHLRCLIWNQKPCHILKTDRSSAHIFNLLRYVNPVFQSIRVAQRIRQRNLCVRLLLHRRRNRRLQITKIVQTVEDTDHVNPVRHRFLYKILYHIVCIRAVSQNILASEQHLQFRVLKAVAEFAESLPRIFLQEPEGRVKCRASPALYGMIPDFVHLLHDRKHLFRRHTCGNQRLMRVTQDRLCYFNWFFLCHFISSINLSNHNSLPYKPT